MKLFLSFGLAVVLGLGVAACGRGSGDSLLLNGLRGKPDETRVTLNEALILPPDDRVVVPNSNTAVASKRNDTYRVHKIMFGEALAQQELDRQLQIQQQNALSVTEQELLRSVRARNGPAPQTQASPKRRGPFNIRLPGWLGSR